jgi:hypothetical protein
MKPIWIVLFITALLLMGCSGNKVSYSKSLFLQLPDKPEAEQTINGITINVKPFDVSKEVQNPKYTRTFNIMYTPYFNPIWEKFERKINIFNGTTTFEVTITNTTDQILKLQETRVMYIDPIVDSPTEPYMALDLGTIIQNPAILPIYDQTIASFSSQSPQNADFLTQVGNEVRGLAQQLKFVNLPNREIMPGMKFTGIVMIPIPYFKITEGRLSFIDVVTKSATAGYAEEKVRFDFTARNTLKYWKLDKAAGNVWVEITENEYNMNSKQIYRR